MRAHTYVVYLVTKADVKVGISRSDRRLQRWAEQGASHAIVVAETPNRKSAGLIEEAFSDRFETQSSSSWYEPRTSPVEDLVEATRTVPEYIPDDSRLHACLTLNDLDEDVVADRVVSIPHRATGIDHARGVNRPELEVGDNGEGTILGVRGVSSSRTPLHLISRNAKVIERPSKQRPSLPSKWRINSVVCYDS